MRLILITKEKKELEREVESIVLPSMEGEMEILPGHADTMVLLKKGVIAFDDTDLFIESGVAKISQNETVILTEGVDKRV